MKRLLLIFLVSVFIPWGSFANHSSYRKSATGLNLFDLFQAQSQPKKKQNTPVKKEKETQKVTTQKKEPTKTTTQPKEKKKKKVVREKKKKKETGTEAEWQFFAGPDLAFGFPLGKIRDSVNNGIGFNVRGEYFLMPQLNVGLATGYKSYKYDQVLVGKGHFSYIPIKLTGTWYFAEEQFRPYVNLGLGVYLAKQKYDADFWTLVQNPQTGRLDTLYEKKHMDAKQTKFGLTPSVGILYNVKDDFFANISLSYDLIFTDRKSSNFIGINLGLMYKFGF
ncbi:MAG: outer membrane beta-barrel protein [Bacteroidetes bacterium]|nr:outer membrane beta-barrel protein [Bacteroidota bacterium]